MRTCWIGFDVISGPIFVPSVGVTVSVECHPWGAWAAGLGDAPIKTTAAAPDGSVPFSCQWDPLTEWDVQPGQQIGVMYVEPDSDRVIDAYLAGRSQDELVPMLAKVNVNPLEMAVQEL